MNLWEWMTSSVEVNITISPTDRADGKDMKVRTRSVLGLMCPVILRGKVILQNPWKKQLDWDDELDIIGQTEWSDVKMDLACIGQVEMKRCTRERTW